MPTKSTKRKRRQKNAVEWHSELLTKHRLIAVLVALIVVGGIAGAEIRGLIVGPRKVPTNIGWIIDGDQLQNLIDFAPSALPHTFFGSSKTIVLQNNTSTTSYIPSGWKSQSGNHYTSFTDKSCTTGCYSLISDIDNQHATINQPRSAKPVALLDDEAWFRTPVPEQTNPCSTMSQFVQNAHSHGLQTIVAPDQDLAEPGLITKYQGGETENWQDYLRLGLASCAAQSATNTYHIMSQPFEAHWCGNPLGECQSSESDFVNFVTQAALQAKAINSKIRISDGLSTATKYFGNFQGAATIAQIMYRDYADVSHIVNNVWMNVVGRNANTTVLYFLSMLGKNQPTNHRSSVFFLQDNDTLTTGQPTSNSTDSIALNKGTARTFISKQTLSGGTTLPAGTGEFQFWTTGTANQYAKLAITLGYCTASKCTNRSNITQLGVRINGGGKGEVKAGGAFTTKSNTVLPNSGSYKLFVQISVSSGGPFNLLYGSHGSSTNLATPILLPLK